MVHQWAFTNGRQKLTSRHVWRLRLSFSLQWLFCSGTAVIDLFGVFMVQFFSLECGLKRKGLWQQLIFQDDNWSLIALLDEMTTLKLVAAASQKIWKVELHVLRKCMWGPTRPSSMVEGSRAWPIVPASEPATVELCSPDEPKGKLWMQTDHPNILEW